MIINLGVAAYEQSNVVGEHFLADDSIKNTKKCQMLPPFSGFPPFIYNPTPNNNRRSGFHPYYI